MREKLAKQSGNYVSAICALGGFLAEELGPNFNYDDEYKRQKRSYRAMKNLTAKYVGMREESEAVYQLQSQRG